MKNLETTLCPICKTSKYDTTCVSEGRDLLYGMPGIFSTSICKKCGLERLNPRPAQSTIGKFYPNNYQPFLSASKKIPKVLHKIIKNQINLPNPKSVLELGCSSGALLATLKRYGYQTFGIEPSNYAAEIANKQGINVICSMLEDAPLTNLRYDLIIAMMVLEHTYDPMSVLTKLKNACKKEGQLVITIPDRSSIIRKIFGNYCFDLQLPTHTYHFDRSTICKLLTMSGWQVNHISSIRSSRSLTGSILLLVSRKAPRLNKLALLLHEHKSCRAIRYILSVILMIFWSTSRIEITASPSK